MNDPNQYQSQFGFPEEWANFDRRHPQWRDCLMNIMKAIDLAFTRMLERTPDKSPENDKFIYMYGRMCVEDFTEILLVVGNGYGVAAMKLLRSFYEHTITLHYLSEHPDEIQKFANFYHVQNYKLMKSVAKTFEGIFAYPPEKLEKARQKSKEVEKQFMVKTCREKGCTCTHEHVNHTWSKLDFVSMTGQVGELGRMVSAAYVYPLRHAHSTWAGMAERVEAGESHMTFQHDNNPDTGEQALMMAHQCLLDVLGVQVVWFKLIKLGEQLHTCHDDFAKVWSPDLLARLEAEQAATK